MRVLFWNTHKNIHINQLLCDMILEQGASIVVLAEYCADEHELIELLSLYDVFMTPYVTIGCERICIFGSHNNVSPGPQNKYASFQIIDNKDLLCCIHLPSRIYTGSENKRSIIIDGIMQEIDALEQKLQAENTIVVGDFNENPFDSGCLDARWFHGIPNSRVANRKTRRIEGRDFKMFYNPMWNLLGDFEDPPGTYYYNGNDTKNPFWNIYDQVIIRPAIRSRFVETELKIITTIGTTSLLNENGFPNHVVSDHLPIIFEIVEDYHD